MSTTEPTGTPRVLASLALPLGMLAALALGTVLARHGLELLREISPATQVDGVVVLVITLAGALLAAWWGLHLVIASLCLLGAASGRRWRAGERLVAAHGPGVVRRVLAAALGASIGLSGLAAASGHEQVPFHEDSVALLQLATSPTTASVEQLRGEGPLDLGWVPTTDHDGGAEPDPDSRRDDGTSGNSESADDAGDAGDAGDGRADSRADADAEEDPGAGTSPGTGDGTGTQADPSDGDAPRSGTGSSDDADTGTPADGGRSPRAGDSGARVGDSDKHTTADRPYVVAPGDSLWSITDELLGGADDARVSTTWPLLFESNRDRLGADPDLIHPGQELTIPAAIKELS